MQFTIIANPENRRCQYFIEAAKSQGFPIPHIIPYQQALSNQVDWAQILQQTDCLRIESFGENFDVWKQLVQRGNKIIPDATEAIAADHKITELVYDRGRIQYSKQLYQGYCYWLKELQEELDQHPSIRIMNSTSSIALTFDKMACHQHFLSNNIAVVPALPSIKTYQELRAKMKQKGWNRVFVKLNHGSSASGVLALRVHKDKIQATTSVEIIQSLEGVKLYNSLKVRRYTDEKTIELIIDVLAKEDLIVEQWIPKASNEQGVFDLRIVVIDGKAQYTVVRQSRMPMTNLHLGNARGQEKNIQNLIGQTKWDALHHLAEEAVQTLPNTLYAGVDVLLSSTYQQQYILETNAFGDLLPNVLKDDLDTYQATIKAAFSKWKLTN
jgi:glutathione synthase/RimK-type ligase-like ATP-grasp enzyme